MRALVIAPLDSIPTTFTYCFAQEVVKYLKSLGWSVNTLFTMNANRIAYALVNTRAYDLIIYTGHGVRKPTPAWVGQLQLVPILGWLQDKSNASKLDRRNVITFCCFGYWLVRYVPAHTYFGSTYAMYVAFPNEEHDYMRDFLDTWMTLVRTYIEAGDPFYALREYKRRGYEYVKEYIRNKWFGWDVYQRAMLKNIEHYNVLIRD